MTAMRATFLLIIVSLLAVDGVSQIRNLSVITGVVRDSVTKRPVENVNVYLSSTTVGVGTDRDGRFVLTNVPVGRYALIASRVGYALQATVIDVTRADTVVHNVVLAPRLITFGDVEVSSAAAEEFRRNLSLFIGVFFGDGPNAAQCTIENPEVLELQFDPRSGMLTASADQPLVITNKSLGYQLRAPLAEFHWDTHQDFGSFLIYPQFKPLVSESEDDSLAWKKNRSRTFEGSFQHFLRALVNATIESEGFVVYSGPLSELQAGRGVHMFPDAIQPEPIPGSMMTRWTFEGWLRVSRLGEGTYRASYITMELSRAIIDRFGVLDNPLSIRVFGRWAHERVADMLPLDD